MLVVVLSWWSDCCPISGIGRRIDGFVDELFELLPKGGTAAKIPELMPEWRNFIAELAELLPKFQNSCPE